MLNSIKIADLEMGANGERDMLGKIRSRWGGDIEPSADKYAVFDFEGESVSVELKSRRIRHNQYADLMIGENKINKASKSAKDVYFVFNCTDGIFYWKYSKDDVANGVVDFRDGGTLRRGADETCRCAYIKSAALLPM